MIFNNESYVSKPWHITLLMWAITVALLIWNFYFRKWINAVEMIGGVSVFVFLLATVIVLAVGAPKNTSEFVFKTLTHGESGWNDPAICWGIGALTAILSLVGELAD
jgi:hypothetical protein